MKKIIEIAGELNKVLAYYTLDEYNIMGCQHFAKKLGISEHLMLSTKCGLTVKTLIYLFGAVYGEKINEISDDCVVKLNCGDNDAPTHTFLYSEGNMYHSYAAKHTLLCIQINKADISEKLRKFTALPNSDNWEKLTGIKDFNFTDRCDVTMFNLVKCGPHLAKSNAITLIKDALQVLTFGKEKYQYDDYTYIFSLNKSSGDLIENSEKFLNDLLYQITL